MEHQTKRTGVIGASGATKRQQQVGVHRRVCKRGRDAAGGGEEGGAGGNRAAGGLAADDTAGQSQSAQPRNQNRSRGETNKPPGKKMTTTT